MRNTKNLNAQTGEAYREPRRASWQGGGRSPFRARSTDTLADATSRATVSEVQTGLEIDHLSQSVTHGRHDGILVKGAHNGLAGVTVDDEVTARVVLRAARSLIIKSQAISKAATANTMSPGMRIHCQKVVVL